MKNRVIGEIFAMICVGFAFSAFKILTGKLMLTSNYHILSWAFIAWGSIDLFINSINLISLTIIRRRVLRICLLNYLVGIALYIIPSIEHPGPKDLGTALDVFMSFIIVAVMVGGGLLGGLNGIELTIWNWSVVLNVLYAGTERLLNSSNRLKRIAKFE